MYFFIMLVRYDRRLWLLEELFSTSWILAMRCSHIGPYLSFYFCFLFNE